MPFQMKGSGLGGGTVAPPSLSSTYVIYKTGSTIYAKTGVAGLANYAGADAATVINQAIAALPDATHEGIVFIKDGDYTINTTITVYKRTQLIGEADAVLTAGGAVNVITIDDTANPTAMCYKIKGFRINCNAKNSIGIYSAHASNTSGWGTPEIADLNIHGVKAGYSGIDIIDIFNIHIHDIHIYTSGTGIIFRVDDAKTIDYGNSLIENIRIEAAANNAVMLEVVSGTYQALCLSTLNNIQLFPRGATYSGCIGLRMTGAKHNTFNGGTIETGSTMVYLDGCESNQFNNMHIGTGSNVIGVQLENACKRNEFHGGYIYVGAGGTLYDDNSSSSATPNKLTGGIYLGAGSISLGTNTAAKEIFLPSVTGNALLRSGDHIGRDIDANAEYAEVEMQAPADFQKLITLSCVVYPMATGTMRLGFLTDFGAVGQNYNTHDVALADQDLACTSGVLNEYDITTLLADLTKNDIAGIRCTATATNTPDLLVLGWRLTYL